MDPSGNLEEVLKEGEEYFRNTIENNGVKSYVILETCNRLEIYYEGDGIVSYPGVPQPSAQFSELEVVRHLFRVASGIESLSVGENEILGQVKDAYEKYLATGSVGKNLAFLFRKAISVGKLSRDRTSISKGKVSIPHFMVDALENSFGVRGKRVLVVGTGKMAIDISRYISEYSPASITVTGRNPVTARELSENLGTLCRPYADLEECASESDVIVTATVSKNLIFTQELVSKIEGGKCYLDVSTPRNVEQSVANLNGNFLISIDSIMDDLKENRRKRESEITRVSEIVERELRNYLAKISEFKAEELLSSMYNYSRIIEAEEIEKFQAAISAGKDPIETARTLVRSSLGKALSPLTFAVKGMIRTGVVRSVEEVLEALVQEFVRDSVKHSGQTAAQTVRRNPRSQIPQLAQKP